jgi:hypothetical protein
MGGNTQAPGHAVSHGQHGAALIRAASGYRYPRPPGTPRHRTLSAPTAYEPSAATPCRMDRWVLLMYTDAQLGSWDARGAVCAASGEPQLQRHQEWHVAGD